MTIGVATAVATVVDLHITIATGDLVGTTKALDLVAILAVFSTGQSQNSGNDPNASLCDHDRSAPVSDF